MSRISQSLARKIAQLINGEQLPYSQLKGLIIRRMLEDGILLMKLTGRSRRTIMAPNPQAVTNFLSNHCGINDIKLYIDNETKGATRAENIIASSDSKNTQRRTFTGFMTNCLSPIHTQINNQTFCITPQEGVYTYIHDYKSFTLPSHTLIVGVENPENFRHIQQQTYLFNTNDILFVSRYPQSNDLIEWLKKQSNRYLHFGDLDFEGIRIFRDEYHKHLPHCASMLIPKNIEQLIQKYGNKELYNKQLNRIDTNTLLINKEIENLIALFHKYKKCLEQEVFIDI